MASMSNTKPGNHWLYSALYDVIALKLPDQVENSGIQTFRVKLCIFIDSQILLFTPQGGNGIVLPSRDVDASSDARKKASTTIVEEMLDTQIREEQLLDLQYLDLVGDEPLLELESSSNGLGEPVIKDRAVLTILLSSSTSSVPPSSNIDGITYGTVTLAAVLPNGSGVPSLTMTAVDKDHLRMVIARHRDYIDQQQQWLGATVHLSSLHKLAINTIYAACCLRYLTGSAEFCSQGFLLKKKGYAGPLLYIMPVSETEAQVTIQGNGPSQVQHRADPDDDHYISYEVLGAFDMLAGLSMSGGSQEYSRVLSKQTGRLHLRWLQIRGDGDVRAFSADGRIWL